MGWEIRCANNVGPVNTVNVRFPPKADIARLALARPALMGVRGRVRNDSQCRISSAWLDAVLWHRRQQPGIDSGGTARPKSAHMGRKVTKLTKLRNFALWHQLRRISAVFVTATMLVSANIGNIRRRCGRGDRPDAQFPTGT